MKLIGGTMDRIFRFWSSKELLFQSLFWLLINNFNIFKLIHKLCYLLSPYVTKTIINKGETSWDKPTAIKLSVDKNNDSDDNSEWIAHEDQDTGMIYYYNSLTNETQWENPFPGCNNKIIIWK